MTLKEKYNKEAIPRLKEKFFLKNDLAVPRIEKAVVNVGLKNYKNEALKTQIIRDLSLITGQKPVLRRAKKSIANFKLRQGTEIGLMTTLRGQRLWDFLERLVAVALPRIRDFRGLPQKSFDGQGNLTIGLKDNMVFPELDPEKSTENFSLEVTIVTNTKTREKSIELFKFLGFPIQDHA